MRGRHRAGELCMWSSMRSCRRVGPQGLGALVIAVSWGFCVCMVTVAQGRCERVVIVLRWCCTSACVVVAAQGHCAHVVIIVRRHCGSVITVARR